MKNKQIDKLRTQSAVKWLLS